MSFNLEWVTNSALNLVEIGLKIVRKFQLQPDQLRLNVLVNDRLKPEGLLPLAKKFNMILANGVA